jgi:hypothetical protein
MKGQQASMLSITNSNKDCVHAEAIGDRLTFLIVLPSTAVINSF